MDWICNYVMFVSTHFTMQMRLYTFLSATDSSTLCSKQYSRQLVCQTNIMSAIFSLATLRNFFLPVYKMNKSSLAFTGKLNQERFSANLTLNWSSAVYLKLAIGKIFHLECAGGIEHVFAVIYGISVA